MRLVLLSERMAGDRVQVGLGGRLPDRLLERLLPWGGRVAAVDAGGRGDAQVGGDELEVRALVAELVDRRAVQVARHQQVCKRDGEQPAQLLGVGPRVADGRGQQRREPGQPVERGSLGAFQRVLDQPGRRGRAALQLAEAAVVRRLLLVPVVQVDQAEQPVAREQGQAERRLDLVAPDEGRVDLRGRIASDQALARHRQPDRGSVLVHPQLVRDLALLLVGEVAGELLVHVGQGVEQALLRLAGGERRVVGVGRLLVEEDRDDVRARGVLKVRDHAAEDRGEA